MSARRSAWLLAVVVTGAAGCGGGASAGDPAKEADGARAAFIEGAQAECRRHLTRRRELERALAAAPRGARARRAADRLADAFDDLIPRLNARKPPAADRVTVRMFNNRLATTSTYLHVAGTFLAKPDTRSARNSLGFAEENLADARRIAKRYGMRDCAPPSFRPDFL